jgi:hypothetical protein
MGRGRDVQLAVAVAPDDGGVLEVDQLVVLQFDEVFPDVLGRRLVRVTDNDQVAHGSTSQLSMPTLQDQACRAASRPHQQSG